MALQKYFKILDKFQKGEKQIKEKTKNRKVRKILGFSPTRQWHLSYRVPVGPAQALIDLKKNMNFKNRCS